MLCVSTSDNKQVNQNQMMTTKVERVNQVHHLGFLLQEGVGASLREDTDKGAEMNGMKILTSLITPETPVATGHHLSPQECLRSPLMGFSHRPAIYMIPQPYFPPC